MSIPVFILSGFLGSGKTTLLLNLLAETARRGLVPGILMNELGRQDVDGAIVQEKISLPVQKLLDGCICCSKRSEVEGSLAQLAAGGPDLIFMELTGVADPAELIAMFSPNNKDLPPGLALERVVSVVDASRFLEYNSRFSAERQLVRLLRSQVSEADIVLMNKCDLAAAGELDRVRRSLRKLNGTAALLPAVRCSMDTASLLHSVQRQSSEGRPVSTDTAAGAAARKPGSSAAVASARTLGSSAAGASASTSGSSAAGASFTPLRMASPDAARHDSGTEHPAAGIRSFTLSLPAGVQLSAAAVEDFLERYNGFLLRAKGYLAVAGRSMLLQFSGSQAEWSEASYPGKPYLVLIGTDLPEERMARDWQLLFS